MDDKCQTCNNNNGQDEHTCPYAEDICDDWETTCNCCDECEQQCAEDI